MNFYIFWRLKLTKISKSSLQKCKRVAFLELPGSQRLISRKICVTDDRKMLKFPHCDFQTQLINCQIHIQVSWKHWQELVCILLSSFSLCNILWWKQKALNHQSIALWVCSFIYRYAFYGRSIKFIGNLTILWQIEEIEIHFHCVGILDTLKINFLKCNGQCCQL